jgi:hypothetical protein
MITSCVLLAVKSYAQADQVVVMVCAYTAAAPGGTMTLRDTITLDLAKKTVAVDRLQHFPGYSPPIQPSGPYQGTVTQITDQQIIFSFMVDTTTQTETLNRYTGDLSMTTGGFTYQWTCQKQQKQF